MICSRRCIQIHNACIFPSRQTKWITGNTGRMLSLYHMNVVAVSKFFPSISNNFVGSCILNHINFQTLNLDVKVAGHSPFFTHAGPLDFECWLYKPPCVSFQLRPITFGWSGVRFERGDGLSPVWMCLVSQTQWQIEWPIDVDADKVHR